jgi:hypothetical protein
MPPVRILVSFYLAHAFYTTSYSVTTTYIRDTGETHRVWSYIFTDKTLTTRSLSAIPVRSRLDPLVSYDLLVLMLLRMYPRTTHWPWANWSTAVPVERW